MLKFSKKFNFDLVIPNYLDVNNIKHNCNLQEIHESIYTIEIQYIEMTN